MNSIAIKLLNHPNFNRYPQDMKDEMRQEAVLKQMKNIKNLDPEKGSLFAYLTQCAWTAFVVYLADHYKQVNLKREILTNALREAQDRNDIQHTQSMRDLLRELDEWQKEQTQKEEGCV